MYTILGSSGFIGRHITAHLADAGVPIRTPAPDEWPALPQDLGHVFYCIGLTADFRDRPFDTIEAHVGILSRFLQRHTYDSFTYLSASRYYARTGSSTEATPIPITPTDPDQLYDLSKLTGEALVLQAAGDRARVARLANVFGADFESDNFLSAVLRDAAHDGRVVFQGDPASTKDYVAVEDVAAVLVAMAQNGRRSIYNIASGHATSHADIAAALRQEGVVVYFAERAQVITRPAIDITAIREDFGFSPRLLADELPTLLAAYRRHFAAPREGHRVA